MLSQEQLTEILAGLTAPDSVKARLAEREYETAEAVSVALDAELSYIAEVAGAGKPAGLGESAQPTAPKARRSQAEHDAAVQQIFTRLGIGR